MCGTGGLSFETTLLGQMLSGEPMQNTELATFVTGVKFDFLFEFLVQLIF